MKIEIQTFGDTQFETQLTFSLPTSAPAPAGHQPSTINHQLPRRRTRASLWFNYMRQLVDAAHDWQPAAPAPQSEPDSN